MKKLNFLFSIVVITSVVSMVNAQTPGSWIVPNEFWVNQIEFNPGGPSIEDSYTPNGYDPGEDKLFSAGGYDDNEDLLFYVVDQQLIDHGTDNVVGNFIYGNPTSMEFLSPEIEIIKVPGNEDGSYYIFYVQQGDGGPVGEGFCYTVIEYDEYQYNVGDKFNYQENGVSRGAIAIGPEKEAVEEIVRDLYYCSVDNGIRKRTINTEGVSSAFLQIVYNNDPYYESSVNFSAYNMEMIITSDEHHLLAWTNRTVNWGSYLFMFKYDEIPAQGERYKIDIGQGQINGIEFSQVDENIIYLSCENAGIYAHDISSGTTQFLTGSENYNRTFLQAAKDRHIYAVSNDVYNPNLGRINNNTGDFESNVLGIQVVTGRVFNLHEHYILPENSNNVFYFDLIVNADKLQCVGDCDADAEATSSSGDISDYTWEWKDENQIVISTTNEATDLCEGEYTVCCTPIGYGNTVCQTVIVELDPFLWDHTDAVEYPSASLPASPWDNVDLSFPRGLTVKAGETLVLTNNTTLMFGEGAKLLVERGATLIVDNSILTNHNACPVFWEGVELWGKASADQTSTEQGKVEVINNGTIENALVGIRTIQIEEGGTDGDPNYNFTGGIILADEARFINNECAVMYYRYSYSSFSRFTDCEFSTDANYLGTTYPYYFMNIRNMIGIQITNCDFINDAGENNDQFGIRNTNSYTVIRGKCLAGDPCIDWDYGLFENLHYGIYATARSSVRFIDVSHTDFDNNFRGIYIGGMTNAVVTTNNFKINTPYMTNGGYGLYLDRSTAYKVEENNFIHEDGEPVGIGLIVHHSGAKPNEIYLNWFTNLQQGVSAQEQNRDLFSIPGQGLQFLCNDFHLCEKDILVPIPSQSGFGIAPHQGIDGNHVTDMAGNLFFWDEIPDNYDDIDNAGSFFDYYYPQNPHPFYVRSKPEDYTTNTVEIHANFIPNTQDGWTFEEGCPPSNGGSGGMGKDDMKDNMAGAEQDISATEATLAQLVDGGDTETLNMEVETSFPPETVEIYNELMNESPYLSETVVESSIEKDEVLPNAMIRDIMVANPHTAKSDELINKLDERLVPVPEYMKAQVLQGRDLTTLKTGLESQLAGYRLKKARAFNGLVWFYTCESATWLEATDSLMVLYQQDNDLESKYRLALLYLDRGEYQLGDNILDDIPASYGLEGDGLTEHQAMESFYGLAWDIKENGSSFMQVTEVQVQELVEIEAIPAGMAGVWARDILVMLGEMVYEEPIQVPDLMKSSEAEADYKELLKTEAPSILQVFPNPSKDYVILGYKLETIHTGVIEIQDVVGKKVHMVHTDELQNQVTVLTQDWKPGVYVASLKINDKVLESVKFTLID